MKKKLLLSGIVVMLIFGAILCFSMTRNKNNSFLETKESLISLQESYEKEFKTGGYTVEQPHIILDPYHISPLTALILFETEMEVTPTVTIHGKDEVTTYTHTFPKATQHYLAIYGLYAGVQNEVTIVFEANGQKIQKTVMIKTNALPNDFILPTHVIAKKEKLSQDLYFFTPSSKGYTCAYDVNGDVRWYLTNYALWDNKRLKNGHLLISTERLLNVPYYMTGLYEIDLFGKIYVEYSLTGGYHHDYEELPNGNLLVASDDFGNLKGTVEDYIVELDRRTGSIVRTFDLKQILNMEDGKSENWTAYDWFHNNSVWYDDRTNSITLSGRHQDAVININYETGALNWILGDPTNWSPKYQSYFFTPVGDSFEWQWSQHAAMITPEGYVFLFDNGNNKSKDKDQYVSSEESYSRGVMYKIDTDEMTIEQIWEYGKERGSTFYSPYISDVDYIEKDHYIVHSGGIVYKDGKIQNQPAGLGGADQLVSDTVEIKGGEVVFELVLPTNNYRVEKMSLYADTEFHLGKGSKLGSLGKTNINKIKWEPIIFASELDFSSHKISFVKEEDRLVVTGQWKRGTKVQVILSQNLVSHYYSIPISKKPYTALCVDIFTEEETQNGIMITSYINREGLKGTYAIYFEINGKKYDTGLSVEF